MDMAFVAIFGVIAVFGILLYCMFITRRTVLRIFGWTVGIFIIGFIFINIIDRINSPNAAVEASAIINDLRNLRQEAILFNSEFKTWPLPGQEASLDAYSGRPIVLAEPPRFAKVMLADKSGDADGPAELYIGVELIPEKNGTANIQKRLAGIAKKSAYLFQRPTSGDVYKSGISVYMQVF
ncbi:MAG: hypothetical protein LBL05_06095 [Synergistaceae bacterium]|jgi:hypothetical protein|nr:hypothetical protein [Synergistaceae bacterium]